jgi:hypothetical protein
MYIRRTHINNSATGERYYTYRLVASQRVDGKPRQLTLLNLGRHFAVDQDWWASLCVRIEQLNFLVLLAHLGINGARIAAIVGSIIGRMAGVGSELVTHNWLMKQSALGEFMEVDYESLPLMTMCIGRSYVSLP